MTISGDVVSSEVLEDKHYPMIKFAFKVKHMSKRGYQAQWRTPDGQPKSIPGVTFTEEDIDSSFELTILQKDKLKVPKSTFDYKTKFKLQK